MLEERNLPVWFSSRGGTRLVQAQGFSLCCYKYDQPTDQTKTSQNLTERICTLPGEGRKAKGGRGLGLPGSRAAKGKEVAGGYLG